MSTTLVQSSSREGRRIPHDRQLPSRIAQLTGLAYVAMAITAGLSFFWIGPQLYVAGDATETMARLVENESLARLGLVLELGVITTGTITAMLFFVLFRPVNPMAAGALTAFGCMSAAVMTISTVFSATALQVASGGLDSNGDAAEVALLLLQLKETTWSIGALFFGLWLLPMGWLALRSGWMPRLLGWALIAGGLGYVGSAALDQLRPEDSTLVEALTLPATIGEFSMMAFLVIRGTFPRRFTDV